MNAPCLYESGAAFVFLAAAAVEFKLFNAIARSEREGQGQQQGNSGCWTTACKQDMQARQRLSNSGVRYPHPLLLLLLLHWQSCNRSDGILIHIFGLELTDLEMAYPLG